MLPRLQVVSLLRLMDPLVSRSIRNLAQEILGVGILARYQKDIWKEDSVKEIHKHTII